MHMFLYKNFKEQIMGKRKNIYRKIRNELREIGDTSVIGYIRRPCFSMSGNREFFAEGNISVEAYTEEMITFAASGMYIKVQGRDLSLCFYSRTSMKITGYITSLEFDEVK